MTIPWILKYELTVLVVGLACLFVGEFWPKPSRFATDIFSVGEWALVGSLSAMGITIVGGLIVRMWVAA